MSQGLSDLPNIEISRPRTGVDWATALGLILTFGLIAGAIWIGQSNANFINIPALMIVLCGTITATAICYTLGDLINASKIFAGTFKHMSFSPKTLSHTLLDTAVFAKKRGTLILSKHEDELRKNPVMFKAMQMVMDGYKPEHIERVLTMEIDAEESEAKKSAGIAKRAAELAPAMGLIGTLIGLVQMLADLENPETLGPSMAVAILTSLYGAILGMVVMSSLASKLERQSRDNVLMKRLIALTAVSIAEQENPRQLEMLLNAELLPEDRITYFD
jgi:chemotaxis protein MotA